MSVRNTLGSLWRPLRDTWWKHRAPGGLLASFGPPPATAASVLTPRLLVTAPAPPRTALAKALNSLFPSLAPRFAVQPVRAVRNFTTARPFTGFAPPRANPRSSSTPFGAGRSSRSYTTGFAYRAYEQGGGASQMKDAFAALKGSLVPAAAGGDEHTAAVRKRGVATAATRPARKGGKAGKARVRVAAAAAAAAGPQKAQERVAKAVPKVKRDLSTLPAEPGCRETVSLSMYLYAPPAWEMDTLHPAQTTRITPSLITEIRTLAALHRDHLSAVAATLETLSAHGLCDMRVVEEDGGVYEIVVRFPPGWSRARVVDCLLVVGLDPGGETFGIVVEEVPEETPENTSPASKTNPAVATFPWPGGGSGTAASDRSAVLHESAEDFLRLVDELRGSRSSMFV